MARTQRNTRTAAYTHANLFIDLWSATNTLNDQLNILQNIPHILKPIDGKMNNSGVVEIGSSPYEAFTEGFTNGWDAVINLWSKTNKFPRQPENIHDAIGMIVTSQEHSPGKVSPVQLYSVKSIGKLKTITILDHGTGIPHDKWESRTGGGGILMQGSGFKTTDPLQHGNYGQGGLTLFQYGQSSMIISRVPNDAAYTFTFVFRKEFENGELSYVYATNPDGTLFRVTASDLPIVAPNSTTRTHMSEVHLKNDAIILPEHGTVRRQFSIPSITNWSGKPTTEDIHFGLQDRFFGSSGYIEVVTDEGGHGFTSVGRRAALNGVAVGEKIHGNWELLTKIVTKTIEIGQHRVRVSSWLVNGRIDGQGVYRNPCEHWLSKPTGSIDSVFFTLNGQTHVRMRNTMILRHADMNWAQKNIIVEVELDDIPLRDRRHVIDSSRTKLKDDFYKEAEHEITKYLRAHREVFEPHRDRLVVATGNRHTQDTQDITACVNQFLTNPLIGNILNSRYGASSSPSRGDTSNHHRRSEKVPVELLDTPTMLKVRIDTVIPGETSWVTFVTNANGPVEIDLSLPDFLTSVGDITGSANLGKFCIQVECSHDVGIGTKGVIVAEIKNARLQAVEEVLVVKERPKRPNTNGSQPGAGTQQIPDIDIQFVDGETDVTVYTQTFGDRIGKDTAFTYQISNGVIAIRYNSAFRPLHQAKLAYANEQGVYDHLLSQYYKLLVAIAMVKTNDPEFGTSGPQTDKQFDELNHIVTAALMTILSMYDTTMIRSITQNVAE